MKINVLYLALFCFLATSLLFVSPASSKGWEIQSVPDTCRSVDLRAVSFADALHGMSCGEGGHVIITENGGLDWRDVTANLLKAVGEIVPFPVTIELYSVWLEDSENGWCAGNAIAATMDMEGRSFPVIFHTSDLGQSWELQYPAFGIQEDTWDFLESGSYNLINDLFFLDSMHGCAVGTGFRYLVTEDGGLVWLPEYLGIITIPELRIVMNATAWSGPETGMIAGFTYDMNFPDDRHGFVASKSGASVDGSWKMEQLPQDISTPVLNDIAVGMETGKGRFAVAVGDSGTILRRNSQGEWSALYFAWPLAFSLPEFRGLSFSNALNGWAVGYFRRGISVDPEDFPAIATVFRTRDSGKSWTPEYTGISGVLNHVDAVESPADAGTVPVDTRMNTDAWAVGDDGLVIHYHNSPPAVCSLDVTPDLIFAGERFVVEARVDDLDSPFEDIAMVMVDATSVGGGVVDLEPVTGENDSRRCVLYRGVIESSPLSTYGLHGLTLTVTDRDGARDTADTGIFIVTSYVDITDTWAVPDPVKSGDDVLLYAHVELVAPKGIQDAGTGFNRIERVMVDISDLEGIDCDSGTDCEAWIPMEYEPAYDLYSARVSAAVPGTHRLPVYAEDNLGHIDKAFLDVTVISPWILTFDLDRDGDVDGMDLSGFSQTEEAERRDQVRMFAREFGMVITDHPGLDILE